MNQFSPGVTTYQEGLTADSNHYGNRFIPQENLAFESSCVIVLGMHRSGTSMLTGCLEEAGLYLGEISEQEFESNKQGQKEQIFLMELHEAVLQSNGGSWSNPPHTAKWKYFHNKTRQHYIETMEKHPVWGFKDPRVLFLLDKWLEDLPSAKMIGIFRHPLLVADSLYRRNNLSYNHSLDLWLKYNRKLWEYKQSHNLPLIEFEQDENQMVSKIQEVIKPLNFLNNKSNFQFLNSQLVNSEIRQIKLPIEIRNLYNMLKANSL